MLVRFRDVIFVAVVRIERFFKFVRIVIFGDKLSV